MTGRLEMRWLLAGVVLSSATLCAGCYEAPDIPQYIQEAAENVEGDQTIAQYEEERARAGNADSTSTAQDPDTIDAGGPTPDADDVVATTCDEALVGQACDSDTDPDTCEDDSWTCIDGTMVCEDKDNRSRLCQIDDACLWEGQHNLANTCEVCAPGSEGANWDSWTPVSAGRLCNEHGLFGVCTPYSGGEMRCAEQPDWLYCEESVPPHRSPHECAPSEPWGGTEGTLRIVSVDNDASPHCPSELVFGALSDALQAPGLEQGSVILLAEGHYEACDLVIPPGVELRSIEGPQETTIGPSGEGCETILTLQPGASLTGLALICEEGTAPCDALTLVRSAPKDGHQDERVQLHYNVFIGGKYGVGIEHASTLTHNTFYGASAAALTLDAESVENSDEGAADADLAVNALAITDALIWGSPIGISGSPDRAVRAANNVYVKTTSPTKYVEDPSPTASGQAQVSGATFDLETFSANDDVMETFILGKAQEGARDIGAIQSACYWNTEFETWRCDHAQGTTNQCWLSEEGEGLWLGQADACVERDHEVAVMDLADRVTEAVETGASNILLEPGVWRACDLSLPEGVSLIGVTDAERTSLVCDMPLSETCEGLGDTPDECPSAAVITLTGDNALVGVNIEASLDGLAEAKIPLLSVSGNDTLVAFTRLAVAPDAVGIQIIPSTAPDETQRVTMDHLSITEREEQVWYATGVKVEALDAGERGPIELKVSNSLISAGARGLAAHGEVAISLSAASNHFCAVEMPAVTIDDTGGEEPFQLENSNAVEPACPEDWDRWKSASFEASAGDGFDIGALQDTCDFYDIAAPESECCYPTLDGQCDSASCAEKVCETLPQCCGDEASWSSECVALATEVCAICGCEAQCEGKDCGADGCDGSCGSCAGDQDICEEGVCTCVPECEGKACGPDGCGGTCGECLQEDPCAQSDCSEGQCVNTPKVCDDDNLCTEDSCDASGECVHAEVLCEDDNPCTTGVCGAEEGECDYTPVADGSACEAEGIPSAQASCQGGQCVCVPDCAGKSCGDDGCGGSCGACLESDCFPESCDIAVGACVAEPDPCDDQDPCSTDGCTEGLDEPCIHVPVACNDDNPCTSDLCDPASGGCEYTPEADGAPCDDGNPETSLEACLEGQCVCTPQCEGKSCGSDGCGGLCGSCASFETCSEAGLCECEPQCEGKDCGGDGCGGFCGPFEGGCESPFDTCISGTCSCVTSCAEVNGCGDDGCGGSCGTCSPGAACSLVGETYQCVSSCTPDCDGRECGSNGCGGSCGSCGAGEVCTFAGACIEDNPCSPQCEGKSCGSDGCGGSCGACGDGEVCTNGECSFCLPDCEGKSCGSDGCGGSCGVCPEGQACGEDATSCTPASACDVRFELISGDYPEEISWKVIDDATGKVVASGGNYKNPHTSHRTSATLTSGSYTLEAFDSFGDGWNGGVLFVNYLNGDQNGAPGLLEVNWQSQGEGSGASTEAHFNVDCGECIDTCEAKSCGPSGCGGSCGECSDGSCTVDGTCEACEPTCAGADCGQDGCGGVCGISGYCDDGLICKAGECSETGNTGPGACPVANIPGLPLPDDSCSPLPPSAGFGQFYFHVSGPNPSWCEGCDSDELAACGVIPELIIALQLVGEGGIILVHGETWIEVSDLVIPENVHVRGLGGPASNTIIIKQDATKGITLSEGATLEGFTITSANPSTATDLEYLVKLEGAEGDALANNSLRFNVIGQEETIANAEGAGVLIEGQGSHIGNNTFIGLETGVLFGPELNATLATNALLDNLFIDLTYPVDHGPTGSKLPSCVTGSCTGAEDSCAADSDCQYLYATSSNHTYCASNPACPGEDPNLGEDFIPNAESVLLAAATNGVDAIGAMQTHCIWSACQPTCSEANACFADGCGGICPGEGCGEGEGSLPWAGCESLAWLNNGCSSQVPFLEGLNDQPLSELGLCVDHGAADGHLAVAIQAAVAAEATTLILGPGSWESCFTTLPAGMRLLSAFGPHYTELFCEESYPACGQDNEWPCPSAGILTLEGGGSGLAGFTLHCGAAEACADNGQGSYTPAIALTGPDAMLSHLTIRSADSTALTIDMSGIEDPEALLTFHLRNLSFIQSGTALEVVHPANPGYASLNINVIDSLFASNNVGVRHSLMQFSSVSAESATGMVNFSGNIFVVEPFNPSTAMGDLLHTFPGDESEFSVGDASIIDINTASESLLQFISGGFEDPNFSLPSEIFGLAGEADKGSLQTMCSWVRPFYGGGDSPNSACSVGSSECSPELHPGDEAHCLQTEELLPFTFEDRAEAGHYLRALVKTLGDKGEPVVLRLGIGEWDVCSIAGPTEFSDETLLPGLHIPSGVFVRSDEGPEDTHITCPAMPADSPAIDELVRMDLSTGLTGVNVDCGTLCGTQKPTIRTTTEGTAITGQQGAWPTLVSFVSARGGSEAAAIRVEADTILDHNIFHDSLRGISVIVTGTSASPSPVVFSTSNIVRDCVTDYIAHNGAFTSAGLDPGSYTLDGIANYTCKGEAEGLVLSVLDESASDQTFDEMTSFQSGCHACIPDPEASEWPGGLMTLPGCPTKAAGTPFDDVENNVQLQSDIGPMQSEDGCNYDMALDDVIVIGVGGG